jgi:hypothetical protein
MKYTRIYTGTDGKAYFEDVEIPTARLMPGQPGFTTIPAECLFFRETLRGKDEDFHNPPNRQFLITVGGEVDIIASGGSTRRFGPGDIFLADDLKGAGHITRVVESKTWNVAFVRLE